MTVIWLAPLVLALGFLMLLQKLISPKLALLFCGILLLGSFLVPWENPKIEKAQELGFFPIDPSDEESITPHIPNITPPKTKSQPPINVSKENLLPAEKDIPQEYDNPSFHPTITLDIKGIKDKVFIRKLEKHLGFRIVRNGNFSILIEHRGNVKQTTNADLGLIEYNYGPSVVSIKIADGYCNENSTFNLAETHYSGKDMKALEELMDLEILDLLHRNFDEIVKNLRACIKATI